uniref:Uncharacterized protein n=1 Tax=Cannabis sativa TaxID=3483 RepID=A0A803QRV7_CANSA
MHSRALSRSWTPPQPLQLPALFHFGSQGTCLVHFSALGLVQSREHSGPYQGFGSKAGPKSKHLTTCFVCSRPDLDPNLSPTLFHWCCVKFPFKSKFTGKVGPSLSGSRVVQLSKDFDPLGHGPGPGPDRALWVQVPESVVFSSVPSPSSVLGTQALIRVWTTGLGLGFWVRVQLGGLEKCQSLESESKNLGLDPSQPFDQSGSWSESELLSDPYLGPSLSGIWVPYLGPGAR